MKRVFCLFQQNGPAGFGFNVSAGHQISSANYNNNNPALSTVLSSMSSPPLNMPAGNAPNTVSALSEGPVYTFNP